MDGKLIRKISIVLGAAAPTPIRVPQAEEVMVNKAITEDLATQAARAAMEKARPLSKNSYKVPLFESIIKQGILKLA